MEKWLVAAKKADFQKWAQEFGISPVLARILRNRDLTEESQVRAFLYGKLEDCHSPFLLKDMDKAVQVVLDAIKSGTKMRVIGDYDVDGICSSFILTKGFQILGADVDTAIPHRIHDGYGLNENLIEEARRDGVRLIVTCDNGISAASQIELANSYGIGVVVTDHHEVPYRTVTDADGTECREEIVPKALAVVDPKRADCTYPFPGICGGVVAYKLIQALAEKTGNKGLQKGLEEFLEFAALSTVCDVMELKDENRILVKTGLSRMRNTRNEGLRALMEVNKIEPEKLNAYHLGFVIGPCLNATGRLDTAKRALELLQSLTRTDAMSAARELKDLNDSRKDLTLQGVDQANQYIEEHHLEQDKVMLVYLPEVHESLAGIIAGRVRERYNHPVFVLTRGEEGLKGSGRSIEGYHMYEAMTEVKEYFTKFGGHAMAAGLSMEEDKLEDLRRVMNEKCTLTEDDFIPRVHIDVPMPLDYANLNLAEELELLEPFGVANSKPLFAQKDLTFTAGRKIGANQNFARFTVVTPEGRRSTLMYFGDLEKFHRFLTEKYGPEAVEDLYAGRGQAKVSVTYQVGKNTFNGRTEVQFVMQNYC